MNGRFKTAYKDNQNLTYTKTHLSVYESPETTHSYTKSPLSVYESPEINSSQDRFCQDPSLRKKCPH